MHKPVLLKEILGILKGHFKDTSNLHIVDATFGQGGYTKQFVKSFKRVSALDRDPMAFAAASKLSEKYPNLHPIHSKFSNISSIFEPESIDAIVFDLGLCSAQISDNSRGFSFMNDGPLDMRMDPSTNTETIGNVRRDKTITAGTIINTFSEHEIADILLKYGEETRSKSIAFEICKQRIKTPFETSIQLANCIEKSVGWYKKGFHPATKSFQALRIYVNGIF